MLLFLLVVMFELFLGGKNNMEDLIQLIYISYSKGFFDQQQLSELLAVCKKENSKHGITGLLLYKSGVFMQVIEGERAEIEQLYKNIENDDSHTGIILLIKESISNRELPDWSMSIQKVPVSMTKEYSQFFTCSSYDNMLAGKAKTLLLSFKNI